MLKKVSCDTCIHSKCPTLLCHMENGNNVENGYCGGCPCEKCDCTSPEKETFKIARKSYIQKI